MSTKLAPTLRSPHRESAAEVSVPDVVAEEPASVRSGRTWQELAADATA
jgi:hypothetical protein